MVQKLRYLQAQMKKGATVPGYGPGNYIKKNYCVIWARGLFMIGLHHLQLV